MKSHTIFKEKLCKEMMQLEVAYYNGIVKMSGKCFFIHLPCHQVINSPPKLPSDLSEHYYWIHCHRSRFIIALTKNSTNNICTALSIRNNSHLNSL